MEIKNEVKDILNNGTPQEIRTLFSFDKDTPLDKVLLKFHLFSRYFFIKFFSNKDAPFHLDMDTFNFKAYKGELKSFSNIAFRGSAKTTRTKLFIAYCILNDIDHSKKYIKVLSKDGKNSTQFVTDVYNMIVSQRVSVLYPEIFAKSSLKKEETMSSFSTHTGVKLTAGTVGTSQRGNIQDESRPDLIIFDDIEDRLTLRSAVNTNVIFINMEEARTGLSRNGSAIYLGNYLSERGNVHRLIQKESPQNVVLIVPIKYNGQPMWDSYTIEEINQIEKDADDFAGEYMCEPSAGHDILFDRSCLERQVKKTPIKVIADFKIFHKYDPSHRYGSGHDVAGGVGLDSSTSVFIDFSTLPARVVATFKSNTIKPDIFGDEIEREACVFGKPIVAPEKNNHGHATIGRLRQIYDNIYFTEQKETRVGMPPRVREHGWDTNGASKPKMLFDFKKAMEDGLLELSDPDLIAEAKSYTRDDLMDDEDDPRLATRHFDLLIAGSIAWQMKNHAERPRESTAGYVQPDYQSPLLDND